MILCSGAVAFRIFSALFALIISAVAVWAVWEAWAWDIQVRLTPWVIGVPTAILAAAVFVQELAGTVPNTKESVGEDSSGKSDEPVLSKVMFEASGSGLETAEEQRRTLEVVGWIVAFALAIWFLGFHIGVPLVTFLYLRIAGRERWPVSVTMSVGIWLSIALLFDCSMHVFFMEGRLFVWLGMNANRFHAVVCQLFAALLPK
jgi:hypothetical protein